MKEIREGDAAWIESRPRWFNRCFDQWELLAVHRHFSKHRFQNTDFKTTDFKTTDNPAETCIRTCLRTHPLKAMDDLKMSTRSRLKHTGD